MRLFMKIRMPRGLASFLVCALWLGCLYFAGLGPLHRRHGDGRRSSGVRRPHQPDWWTAPRSAWKASRQNVYRTLVPRRFQDQDAIPPPPETPALRGKRKPTDPPPTPPVQEVRVRQEPTAMVSYIYDYLQLVLQRPADGVVHSVPGVLHPELGRSPALAPSVHAGGRTALHRRQGPGRRRRHGARLRGRQLSAGRIAERGQRDPVRLGQPALLAGGGSDERIPEPGPLYRDAAGADSAADRRASERRSRAVPVSAGRASACCTCSR